MLTLTLKLSALDESQAERTYTFPPCNRMDRRILVNALDESRIEKAEQEPGLAHFALSAIATPLQLMRDRTELDLQSMAEPLQRETALRLRRDVIELTKRGGVVLSATLS